MSVVHRRAQYAWATPWAVAEVFAGVGSVARGFANSGLQVAYLNDVDSVARRLIWRTHWNLVISPEGVTGSAAASARTGLRSCC